MIEFEVAEVLKVSVLDLPQVPLYRIEQAGVLLAAREGSKLKRAVRFAKMGAQAVVSVD